MTPEIQRARQFRQAMSEPEVILWACLKRLRDRGFHIRRQAPFHGYYLDFVCYPRRLVIEVDGGQHNDDAQADLMEGLIRLGIRMRAFEEKRSSFEDILVEVAESNRRP